MLLRRSESIVTSFLFLLASLTESETGAAAIETAGTGAEGGTGTTARPFLMDLAEGTTAEEDAEAGTGAGTEAAGISIVPDRPFFRLGAEDEEAKEASNSAILARKARLLEEGADVDATEADAAIAIGGAEAASESESELLEFLFEGSGGPARGLPISVVWVTEDLATATGAKEEFEGSKIVGATGALVERRGSFPEA